MTKTRAECVFVPNKHNCPVDPDPGTETPPACEEFSVCMGNHTLSYDGKCLALTPRSFKIEDGTYSSITFVGGCIVGVGAAQVPAYTPSACCDDAGSGTGGPAADVVVDPRACNWLSHGAAGLLVAPTLQAGSGVSFNGCGTADDPLIISMAATGSGTQVYASSAATPISVQGTGLDSSPLLVGMNPSGITAGTYAGFEVNSYGLITGYDEVNGLVTSLVSTGGVAVAPVGTGAWSVGLEPVLANPGTVSLGIYTMTVDQYGRITNVTMNPGTAPLEAGRFYSPAVGSDPAKFVYYDSTGVIVRVEPYTDAGGGGQ